MKKNIEVEDFLDFNILSNIKMNDDATFACFLKMNHDLENDSYKKEFYLLNLKTKKKEKLNIKVDFYDFIDKETILYKEVENNKSLLKKINIISKEISTYLEIDDIFNDFYIYNEEIFYTKRICNNELNKNYEIGDELPFYQEGVSFSSNHRKSIFKINLKTNEKKRITNENLDISDIKFKDNKVVFIGYDIDGIKKVNSSIYLMNLDDLEIKLISSKDKYRISYVHFLDDNIIFCATDQTRAGRNSNHEFYKIDLLNFEESQITTDFDESNEEKMIMTDAKFGSSSDTLVYKNKLYFLITKDLGSYIYSIDKDGNICNHSYKSGSIDSYDIKNDEIYAICLRETSLQEIYKINMDVEECITDFNLEFKNTKNIIKPKHIVFENLNQEKIDGFILEPLNFDKNKDYSAILNIHGGPKAIFSHIYFHELQLLASKGYLVIYCNPRGSDGKKDKFADIRGNFYEYAYEDLMLFTDIVLEKYKNIKKLGVMGGSYGGYMTNVIITKNNKFNAAISQRGISNMISMFNSSDIGFEYVYDYMGGISFWDDKEKYLDASPINFANEVKTPTLFIHGKEDRRCPFSQSVEMYSALKYFNVDTKMCLFENERHSLVKLGKPSNKIVRFNEILGWFDKYLKIDNK